MPLTGGGEELRHGHYGEPHESIGLSNFLSLVPHLKQNLTAALRNFTKIRKSFKMFGVGGGMEGSFIFGAPVTK